jgi:tripartite-type tricarboxylate transporter receptor subunit TctC
MVKQLMQAICCAALCSIQAAHPAAAQSWPARPIKLVVPYPPGGSTDVTAHLVAENLRPLLGQPVVIVR